VEIGHNEGFPGPRRLAGFSAQGNTGQGRSGKASQELAPADGEVR
jgi:hypothetical protein